MRDPVSKVKKVRKVAAPIISLIVPAIFLVCIYFICGIMFDTNDDRVIAGLISGEISGENSTVEYCNFWITAPLSFLYRLFPTVPFWGLFLLAVIIISDALIILSFYRLCSRLFLACFTNALLIASVLYMLSEINYTGVSMLAAIAGYATLIPEMIGEEKNKRNGAFVIFFIMEFLSVCIRKDSMLLIQPFGLTLYLSLIISEYLPVPGEKAKHLSRKCIPVLAEVVGAILIALIVFQIGNLFSGKTSEEYRKYYHYNNMRTAIMDYYSKPVSYDEIKGFTSGTNITESRWNAAMDYTAWDLDVDPDVYRSIEEYVYGQCIHPGLRDILKGVFEYTFLKHSFWLILLLALFTAVLSILKEKMHYIVAICLLLAPHFLAWGYLIYNGRIMQRIQYPLFFCEGICAAMILLALIGKEPPGFTKRNKIITIIAAMVSLAGALMIGQGQYEECLKANRAKESLVRGIRETVVYCEEHPGDSFILDNDAFGHYFGGPFESSYSKPSNYTLSGGWFSMMPDHARRMREIIEGEEAFYYIVADYGDAVPESMRISGYTADYFREVTGREPEMYDTYESSFGVRFLVYRF